MAWSSVGVIYGGASIDRRLGVVCRASPSVMHFALTPFFINPILTQISARLLSVSGQGTTTSCGGEFVRSSGGFVSA